MILRRYTLLYRVYIRSTFRLLKTARNYLTTDQLGKDGLKRHSNFNFDNVNPPIYV